MMITGFGPEMGHGPLMGCGPMMGRHFITKEEKVELLERYREWLEKEAKGVNELIEELKGYQEYTEKVRYRLFPLLW